MKFRKHGSLNRLVILKTYESGNCVFKLPTVFDCLKATITFLVHCLKPAITFVVHFVTLIYLQVKQIYLIMICLAKQVRLVAYHFFL